MKLPCALIRDLLPLYHDNVCAPETSAAVEEHLAGCEPCQEFYHELEEKEKLALLPLPVPPQAASLQKVKKKIRRKTVAVALGVLAACIGVFFGVWLLRNVVIVTMPAEAIESIRPGQISGGDEPVPTLDIIFAKPAYSRHGLEYSVTPVKIDGKQEFFLILSDRTPLWDAVIAFFQEPIRLDDSDDSIGTLFISSWENWEGSYQPAVEAGEIDVPEDTECIFSRVYYFSEYSRFKEYRDLPGGEIESFLASHATLLWTKPEN